MSAVRDPAAGVVDQFLVEFVGVNGVLHGEPLGRCAGMRFEEVAPAQPFPTFKWVTSRGWNAIM